MKPMIRLIAWTVAAGSLVMLHSTASAQTTRPTYPPTTEGLAQMFREIIDASVAHDADKLLKMCDAMVLPDAPKWFKQTFGDELGTKLAAAYQKDMVNFAPGLAK